MPLRRSEQWFQNQDDEPMENIPSEAAVEAFYSIGTEHLHHKLPERLAAAYAIDFAALRSELETFKGSWRVMEADLVRLRSELQAARNEIADLNKVMEVVVQRGDDARAALQSAQAEVERLKTKEHEVFDNPDKWMKWCDIRVLERCEAIQAALDDAIGLLRKVTKIDKRSINLPEQWEALLVEITAFLEKK